MRKINDGLTRYERYRLKWPERVKATDAKNYQKNKAKRKQQAKAWKKSHPEKRRAISKRYCKRHPEYVLRRASKRRTKHIITLHDHYIRHILRHAKQPQPLIHDNIEQARVRIQTHRASRFFRAFATGAAIAKIAKQTN